MAVPAVPAVCRYTSRIGRVGALAVFLGVGAAIAYAPAALADNPGATGPGSTSSPSAADSAATDSGSAKTSEPTADDSDFSADKKHRDGVNLGDHDTDAGEVDEIADPGSDEGPRSNRSAAPDGARNRSHGEGVPAAAWDAAPNDDPAGEDPASNGPDNAGPAGEERADPPEPRPAARTSAGNTNRGLSPADAGAEDVATGALRTVQRAGAARLRLFGDGTAENPNAGILFGNGFSWDASSCTGGGPCHGGHAGLFAGNGGNGFNGGHGGSAGWFGSGGNGGAGVPGRNGGHGGRGGTGGLFGTGGHAGGDSAPTASIGARDESDEAVATDDPVGEIPVQEVTVQLPAMPANEGWAYTVTPDFLAGFAGDYVAGGGDPADGARFFFGDLAVASLDALADEDVTGEQVRLLLGNLAVSGYFGGVWLRDNLRDTGAASEEPAAAVASAPDLTLSALAIGLFDALAAGLTGAAASPSSWVVTTAARASVPVLLTLYGYNRGYLEVVLENPPEGVPSMQDSLACDGFLGCTSSAFPLAISTTYDGVLDKLDGPPQPRWREMALWTSVLEGATGTGRSVWEGIARRGAFSPESYAALVELSSAYLMVSKAAVLSSMLAYAGADAGTGRSSLRLQAGLWIWSGAYFGGLASGAPAGTMPTIHIVGE